MLALIETYLWSMVRRLIYGNVLLILMLSAKMGALAEAALKNVQ
jgi:hypothetical protein